MGKITNSENIFHPNSYVCSQELDFILNNHDPQVLLYEDESICLFNKHFVFEEAFFSDMDLLLDLARYSSNKLENCVSDIRKVIIIFSEICMGE